MTNLTALKLIPLLLSLCLGVSCCHFRAFPAHRPEYKARPPSLLSSPSPYERREGGGLAMICNLISLDAPKIDAIRRPSRHAFRMLPDTLPESLALACSISCRPVQACSLWKEGGSGILKIRQWRRPCSPRRHLWIGVPVHCQQFHHRSLSLPNTRMAVPLRACRQ